MSDQWFVMICQLLGPGTERARKNCLNSTRIRVELSRDRGRGGHRGSTSGWGGGRGRGQKRSTVQNGHKSLQETSCVLKHLKFPEDDSVFRKKYVFLGIVDITRHMPSGKQTGSMSSRKASSTFVDLTFHIKSRLLKIAVVFSRIAKVSDKSIFFVAQAEYPGTCTMVYPFRTSTFSSIFDSVSFLVKNTAFHYQV